ncbi:hypothetical protein Hanom_Chr10g00951961 [Helianthus anomalus]
MQYTFYTNARFFKCMFFSFVDKMSNLSKLEFAAIDISGNNYLPLLMLKFN